MLWRCGVALRVKSLVTGVLNALLIIPEIQKLLKLCRNTAMGLCYGPDSRCGGRWGAHGGASRNLLLRALRCAGSGLSAGVSLPKALALKPSARATWRAIGAICQHRGHFFMSPVLNLRTPIVWNCICMADRTDENE